MSSGERDTKARSSAAFSGGGGEACTQTELFVVQAALDHPSHEYIAVVRPKNVCTRRVPGDWSSCEGVGDLARVDCRGKFSLLTLLTFDR